MLLSSRIGDKRADAMPRGAPDERHTGNSSTGTASRPSNCRSVAYGRSPRRRADAAVRSRGSLGGYRRRPVWLGQPRDRADQGSRLAAPRMCARADRSRHRAGAGFQGWAFCQPPVTCVTRRNDPALPAEDRRRGSSPQISSAGRSCGMCVPRAIRAGSTLRRDDRPSHARDLTRKSKGKV